jgi:hypothetical protein
MFPKIFERMMCNRLNKHLQVNNLLVPEEIGFRKEISTENAVFTLTDNIPPAINTSIQFMTSIKLVHVLAPGKLEQRNTSPAHGSRHFITHTKLISIKIQCYDIKSKPFQV